MDIHKMGCSTRQSMAEAVEKAYIVLCCMSAKYKDSLPCRQEAEYADDLRKTIIPLKMERDYKADGWLGLMVAGKLFYDFSGKYPFDTKFQELVKAVREAGDVIPRDGVDGYVAPEPDVEDVGPVMKLEKRMVAYTAPPTHQAAAPDLEKV
ncbi:hypothetical protein BaRGS_00005833 [Batillaria attramentaria]|uniref:TIR domain-containing protein n=1 Tax=Batillaria attramentaria TaxID=370345 RepID=A0ABD0LV41_9CAEN